MSDGKRAFMMGNALVVGLVERVARRTDPRDRASPIARGGARRGLASFPWLACNFRTRHRRVRPYVTSCGQIEPATPAPNCRLAGHCAKLA